MWASRGTVVVTVAACLACSGLPADLTEQLRALGEGEVPVDLVDSPPAAPAVETDVPVAEPVPPVEVPVEPVPEPVPEPEPVPAVEPAPAPAPAPTPAPAARKPSSRTTTPRPAPTPAPTAVVEPVAPTPAAPPAPTRSVSVVISVDGSAGIDGKVMKADLRRSLDALTACWTALPEPWPVSGKVVLSVKQKKGANEDASVTGKSGQASADACVLAVVKRAKLSEEAGSGKADVSISFSVK